MIIEAQLFSLRFACDPSEERPELARLRFAIFLFLCMVLLHYLMFFLAHVLAKVISGHLGVSSESYLPKLFGSAGHLPFDPHALLRFILTPLDQPWL